MIKDNKRYCDRCGVELTKKNNICGFELCDKCNEVLGQQLAIKNYLPHCQHTDEEIAKSFIEDVEAVKDQLPTAKNDLGVREFEGIEVTYPPEEVCIYPEYKGKPYFAIKYKENGKEMVGYGTYNPEVLSQYLKDYFISTTKNNLGVDCISREQALNEFCIYNTYDNIGVDKVRNYLKALPSVTPQEPRKGYWLRRPHVYGVAYCSICDFELKIDNTNYCPNCGAKMESEE